MTSIMIKESVENPVDPNDVRCRIGGGPWHSCGIGIAGATILSLTLLTFAAVRSSVRRRR